MTARRWLAAVALAVALAAGVAGLVAVLSAPTRTSRSAEAGRIDAGLRCPVCQGLSVADSPSTVAAGMRRIVSAQLAAGRTPAQVRAFFVARYGSWILLDPPRRGVGWLVWLVPVAALVAGGAAATWVLRRQRAPAAAEPAELPTEVRARVDRAYELHEAGAAFDSEELSAALALLSAVREDPASEPAAARLATARVAAALPAPAAPAAPAAPPPRTPADSPAATTSATPVSTPPAPPRTPPARRSPRHLALISIGAVFVVVAGVLLGTAVRPRPAGAPPTGTGRTVADVSALRADAQAHPHQESAWLALGVADDSTGNLVAAYHDYQQAVTIAPKDLQAKLLLAGVLVQGGSPQEAVRLLSAQLPAHPNDANLLLDLGLAQHDVMSPDAPATLRRFLQLAPKSPYAAQVRKLLAG